MKSSTAFGIVTFVSAAATCAVVTSSYPIAIWTAAFAALRLAQKKPESHIECPLMQAAATKEGAYVVAQTHAEYRENRRRAPHDAG